MLFNQYRWGTLNSPASALYSVTYLVCITCCTLASPGAQLQEIAVSTFSIQLGPIRLQSTIGLTKAFGRLQSYLTQLDRKSYDVISCNWAPGEAGNSRGKILENAPTHSEARKAIFPMFSGQTLISCEPTERCISNGLQI